MEKQMKAGDQVWYYQIKNMTHLVKKMQSEIVKLGPVRITIKLEDGKIISVNPENIERFLLKET